MRQTDPAPPETLEAALRRLKQLERARYAAIPGTPERVAAERAEKRLAQLVWTLASRGVDADGE